MFTLERYFNGADLSKISDDHKVNAEALLKAVNALMEDFYLTPESKGLARYITSGHRSAARHEAIYKDINDKRKAKGLPPIPVPMKSNHLYGKAVDISDTNDALKAFCQKNNHEMLVKHGLYMEAATATDSWCHLQTKAPLSGKREFLP